MIYTSATEYAIRGLAELAGRAQEGPVLLADLVAGTDLPKDFVAKVFQKLVHGGVLRSAKGRGGGFTLARPAHQITLMEILQATEGTHSLEACVVGMERCNDHMPCPQHDLYKPIRQRLKDYLNTTTVADLASSLKAKLAWHHVQAAESAPGAPPLVQPVAQEQT
jgi:Rrf2 family protein